MPKEMVFDPEQFNNEHTRGLRVERGALFCFAVGDLSKLQAGYARLKQGALWSSTGKCKGYAASNPTEAAEID